MSDAERHAYIEAPAKINLGLEILGKRRDGFHEIRSILAMIDLADGLVISKATSTQRTTHITGMDLCQNANLIDRAAQALDHPLIVQIEKRIPLAAGLGGASTDAAATLVAGNMLLDGRHSAAELSIMAASLGSDVPFFLGMPCASAAGTGTDLIHLPSPTGWLVLVTPTIVIREKTGTLYNALTYDDFSTGASVARQSKRMLAGNEIDPSLLVNSFSRPLAHLSGEIDRLRHCMIEAGCPFVALSGAGPTHYSLLSTEQEARNIAAAIAAAVTFDARIFVSSFRTTGLRIQMISDLGA